MAKNTEIAKARRCRLQAWIDAKFGAAEYPQKAFIADAKARGYDVNQGELSALLSTKILKSFGEQKAITLEEQGAMPKDYLVRPFDQNDHVQQPAPAPVGAEHITELREILGLTAQALVASTPIAGRELVKAIRDKVGSSPNTFAGELVKLLESQLSDLADTFPRKHRARGSR